MEILMPFAMVFVTLTGILLGYRVGMVFAGSAAIFILVSDIPIAFFKLINSRIYANVLTNWLLVAIPMFIFMGLLLEKSKVGERSLRAAQKALGGSPVGMGLSVLVIGVLLAASSGVVGASVVLLSLLALPRMLEAGFDKPTSAGLVASSGTLAILIPPSVMLIVLGDQLQVPVPDMFAAAVVPGALLILCYGAYVTWRSRKLPRQSVHQKLDAAGYREMLRDLLPLVLLIIVVLGSIVGGFATPTEASGLGAFGAVLLALFYRQFSLEMMMQAARETVGVSAMVLFIMIGATAFSAVFKGVGGDAIVEGWLGIFGDTPWAILGVAMLTVFVLGFVMDWLEITLILLPIVGPIIATLDFGNGLQGESLLLWFGMLVAVNLQTSFLTPPFGFSLFYLKGAAGSNLMIRDIYLGVLPFIFIQLFVLGLMVAFPGLATFFI